MSKFKEELRTLGVFNDHGFFNGEEPREQVWISHMGRQSVFSSRWLVYRIGHKTDPEAHWSDYGNKAFICFGGKDGKEEALAEAQAWAGKRYGITEWARSPFGGYGDATFVAERKAELRRLLKERKEADDVARVD